MKRDCRNLKHLPGTARQPEEALMKRCNELLIGSSNESKLEECNWKSAQAGEQAAAARLSQARDEFQQAHTRLQEPFCETRHRAGSPRHGAAQNSRHARSRSVVRNTIRAAIQQLRTVALAYQHQVDSAIAEYRNSAAATFPDERMDRRFKARARAQCQRHHHQRLNRWPVCSRSRR